MIQPSFAPARLAEYSAVMASEAQTCARSWRDGAEIDLGRAMMELTLRIVSQTLFSHDVRGDTDAVRQAMATLTSSVAGAELLPDWVPNPWRRRLTRAVGELDRIIYGLIDRRRSGVDPSRPDLLQALVSAVDDGAEGDGGGLSEQEVRDELVTMFLAGHETTSHALTWTFALLAQSPHVEAKLHAELDSVLGGRTPTHADHGRLPYTEAVVCEAMRLYPPAFLLARKAHRDTHIGAYEVAAGSEVVIWTYMTHRDPRWYPDPDVFSPERFSAELRAARPKLAYLPFGAGSRACIGKQFAMIEAVTVLATIAQSVRLELLSQMPLPVKPRVTLAPARPVMMRVHQR